MDYHNNKWYKMHANKQTKSKFLAITIWTKHTNNPHLVLFFLLQLKRVNSGWWAVGKTWVFLLFYSKNKIEACHSILFSGFFYLIQEFHCVLLCLTKKSLHFTFHFAFIEIPIQKKTLQST